MDNLNSRSIKNIPSYFNSLTNDYSTNENSSFLNKDNRYQNISNKLINQNDNNYLMYNLQKRISNDRLNKNLLAQNDLQRFHTQKNIRKVNINTQKKNYYTMPDDNKVTFAKKSNIYSNNNGKRNNINIKNLNINNNIIARKLNKNYNPKFYSSNNNNVLINNNILLDNNNNIIKRKSNNIFQYNNYDLN